MKKYSNIPCAKPYLDAKELACVRRVFDTGWLGMGSVVHEFEEALKNYLGVRNVIAVNTGTSALHIALESYGIGAGDEVIVPSLTFVATAHAVSMCGAKAIFCDVDEDTLNIDIDDAAGKITKNTRAILPVHYSGLPCDMDALLNLAQDKHMHVIEDAAHAFGSAYKGKKIGSFGDAACFSFDPIKVITCGEGGAVATNDDDLARIIIRKRILGIDKDTWSRYKHKRSWFYEVKELGYRYHMSNMNAAIGLEQLGKIDIFLDRRREIAAMYDKGLKRIGGIGLIEKDYRKIAPFNYIVKIKDRRRVLLMAYLKRRGIETGVHYLPNHMQPFYKAASGKLPVTEKVALQILTLPLYYGMSDEDATRIISSIKNFFKGVSR
ncbi:MAG: DegT/DnrJ/EryC1/StrS family aminotransferase [Candidatus Omnitrophota bacterium]|jgi:perosamine synthetase